MKILHISHSGLPDGRIEKMCLLDKILGHESSYLGPESHGTALGVFDNIYQAEQSFFMHIGFPNANVLQQKMQDTISKINPDIIHLHNIQNYGLVSNSGYPFIFDDHECLSKEVYYDAGRRIGIKRKLAFPIQLSTWRLRERNAANHVPIITVSEPIAAYYRNLGGNVDVIPNYPSEYELLRAKLSKKVDKITSVYQGTTNLKDTCSYRDSTGFVEFFKEINKPLVCIGATEHNPSKQVSVTGHIPHMEIFTELSKYHVGIIPWRKHPFHKYCSPNKAYFYAHCGMVVIVTSLFESVIKRFQGRCRTVGRFEDLKAILDAMEEDKESVIVECQKNGKFAREHFIFEKYIEVLKEAYKNA